jgi:hypothetical protein
MPLVASSNPTPSVPNAFQKKALWMAITALSVAVTGALVVGFIWIITRVLSFLQPILIPFAIAGVMAYLLEPVVVKLKQWGLSRQKAVWVVFTVSIAAIVGISFIVIPAFVHQGAELAGKMPEYTRAAKRNLTAFATKWNEMLKGYGVDLLHWDAPTDPASGNDAGAGITPTTPATPEVPAQAAPPLVATPQTTPVTSPPGTPLSPILNPTGPPER